jgi:hypothetical protein
VIKDFIVDKVVSRAGKMSYGHAMKATELLSQVRALPSRERRRFLAAIRTLEEDSLAGSPARAQRVTWPDVEARSKRIFGGRVLPNLVLVEREEEAT